jgi:hypothetical protein
MQELDVLDVQEARPQLLSSSLSEIGYEESSARRFTKPFRHPSSITSSYFPGTCPSAFLHSIILLRFGKKSTQRLIRRSSPWGTSFTLVANHFGLMILLAEQTSSGTRGSNIETMALKFGAFSLNSELDRSFL